jgi:hypothetical protein
MGHPFLALSSQSVSPLIAPQGNDVFTLASFPDIPVGASPSHVDATYTNELCKHRFKIGYAFTLELV